jgi:superfamily I DNA and RNA helicase
MLDGAECDLDGTRLTLVRGVVQPETVITNRTLNRHQLQIFSPPEEGDIIRVMDRKQEALAKSLGTGHRVVRGVAGSGKTLVLMYRARLLTRMQPRKRFLLTCYTRTLAGQLRHLLADSPNVEVTHIDGLMSKVIRSAGMKHPGYKDDGAAVWSAALQAQGLNGIERYDAVLVDEAQDFSTEMLQFTVGLVADDGDLVVVADAAQNIFRRNFSWKSAGIQAQGRTRILRTNYRNTREILEFAHGFLMTSSEITEEESPDFENENQVIPPEAASREGPPPVVSLVPRDKEGDAVVSQVTQWASEAPAGERIAVLYASSSSVDVQGILDQLKTSGCNVFWLTDPSNMRSRDALAESTADVILSTIHSAKGLEFPRAVICGLWREGEEETANRMTAYVGMTRAQNHLAVIHPEDGPLAEELRNASGLAATPA